MHACVCMYIIGGVGCYGVDTKLKLVQGCRVVVKIDLNVDGKKLRMGSVATFSRIERDAVYVVDTAQQEWELSRVKKQHWMLLDCGDGELKAGEA